jgi:hypothetical protein
MPYRSLSCWPPYKKVDTCANKMRQHDNQYPHNFILTLGGLICRTVHNHPDPENRPENADKSDKSEKADND